MFLDELTPIAKEFIQNSGAFLGGFMSAVLRLNLNDDPVKTWIDRERGGVSGVSPTTPPENGKSNGGPQSISID